MDRVLTLLPWAFSAGMLATINPCGFALLPAYLTYLLGRTEGTSLFRNLSRAAGAGMGMTAGVLGVFLTGGTAISAVGSTLTRFIPVLGLIAGVAVAGVGLRMLLQPSFNPTLPAPQFSERVARSTGGLRFVAFGAGYGLASLGCTLPIFLVVTAQALSAGGLLPGVLVFLAYGLGMGSVLVVLSLTVGGGSTILVRFFRSLAPSLHWIGGAGMVAAGTYLAYYQLVYGRVLVSVP